MGVHGHTHVLVYTQHVHTRVHTQYITMTTNGEPVASEVNTEICVCGETFRRPSTRRLVGGSGRRQEEVNKTHNKVMELLRPLKEFL